MVRYRLKYLLQSGLLILGLSPLMAGTAAAQIKVDARLHTFSGSCSNCDLSNKTMTRMKLQNADMSGSVFNRSNLSGGLFDKCDLSKSHFRKSYLVGVKGSEVNMEGSVFHDATLIEADLSQSNLKKADLRRADMTRGIFTGSKFIEANLTSATAEKANFSQAVFNRATADHINLNGANLTDAIIHHASFGNASFTDTKLTNTDLTGSDLHAVTGLTQAQLDSACGSHLTRLPAGLSVAHCDPTALQSVGTRARNHKQPRHLRRASQELDDAIKSIESLLSRTDDSATRHSLQAVHADIIAARDALDR